ncbi:MAG: DUF2157 domain-containing protein [Flavobacteriales bacterium]|nr:DUF2157 domain-containing protein [Flavobacteriales bacterium]
MSDRGFLKALPELEAQGLLSAEQAERIRAHYQSQPGTGTNRGMVLFSILGGLLIGLGVVLLVAHNWDQLGRGLRTVLALAPMAMTQGLCAWVLLKRSDSRGWREGTALGLAFMVAAALSLIAQIHQIPGELEGFLFTWALLIIGVVYVMRSVAVALVYLVAITWYGGSLAFDRSTGEDPPWLFIPLLLAIAPFFFMQLRQHGRSAGFGWLAFFSALALGIGLQFYWEDFRLWHMLAPIALASGYTLVPWSIPDREARVGAFTWLGGATILGLLFALSWLDFWTSMDDERQFVSGGDLIPWIVQIGLGVTAYALAWGKRRPFERVLFPEVMWVLPVLLLIGLWMPGIACLLVNLGLLAIGVVITLHGSHDAAMGRLNLGLAVIATTIAMRFFDLDLSFALRGLLFIALGIGFLVMNLRTLRAKRNKVHA